MTVHDMRTDMKIAGNRRYGFPEERRGIEKWIKLYLLIPADLTPQP